MDKHIYHDLTGTDGLFTYHFFCEALISNLNSLVHAMEHDKTKPPALLQHLPEQLSQIGIGLMDDYKAELVNFDRLKKEMDELYDLAYHADFELESIVEKCGDEVKYYYFLLHQGIRLLFPNLIENCVSDLPETADFKELSAFLHAEPEKEDACCCHHE